MQEKQQALGELDGKVQRTLTTAREYKLRPTKIQSKTQNKNYATYLNVIQKNTFSRVTLTHRQQFSYTL